MLKSMAMVPYVLIGTMYNEAKAYALPLFLDWLTRQDYSNSWPVVRIHTGPYGSHHAVKAMRESLRLQALEEAADYLFFLDIDVVPPPDAINRLLAVSFDRDVALVTGIYFSRAPSSEHRAVAWKHSDPDQSFLWTEAISEIDGAGMGCCLIRRDALAKLSWDYGISDDDFPAFAQAKRLGFRCLSLNSLRCRHYTSEGSYVIQEAPLTPAGPMEEVTVTHYEGITVNGQHYAKGKHLVHPTLAGQMRLIGGQH